MRFKLAILLLPILLVLGCHKSDPIVGSWTSGDKGMAGTTITFRPDGTMDFVISPKPDQLITTVGATYKLEGAKLTSHVISFNSSAGPKASAKLAARIDKQNQEMSAHLKDVKPIVAEIVWKGDDSFTMISNGKSINMVRKR